MTSYHKELERIAQRINEMEMLHYNICVNRRNGYYAIDKIGKSDTNYYGACFVGDFRDVRNHLIGMTNAIYLMKAF